MSRDTRLQPQFWTNPFSTHRVRPGSLQFRFADDDTLDQLFQDLRQHGWIGQIVGPHGSGKTTLLHTLDEYWQCHARQPVRVTLRDRQRAMPQLPWYEYDDATQLIVDGYEQLSGLERWRLQRRCRARGCGLLVTSHQKQNNLPVLFHTQASVELVHEIVRELLRTVTDIEFDEPLEGFLGCLQIGPMQSIVHQPQHSLVETRFAQAKGNVRETIMLLYDDAEIYFRSRYTS